MAVTLKVPDEICYKISVRATELAKLRAPKRTGLGAQLLQPTKMPGRVGVHVPQQVLYMLYQERGFGPFNMYELEGKTIPMRTPSGQIQFRRAKNVGRRKITSRDEKGHIVSSKIAWRHPGLEPKHFIRDSIKDAIREYLDREIQREDFWLIMDENQELREFIALLRSV